MEMVIAVGFGGAAGAILRWLTGILTNNLTNQAVWGTLFVNLVGSFLVGFLFIFFQGKLPVGDVLRTGILVGLLGGFTTFSAFSMETVSMMMAGFHVRAMMYVVASVALCLAGTWIGVAIARSV